MLEKNLGCFDRFFVLRLDRKYERPLYFQCIRIIIASTSHIEHDEFVKARHRGINRKNASFGSVVSCLYPQQATEEPKKIKMDIN